MKKFISVFLSVLMILSSCLAFASAEDEADKPGTQTGQETPQEPVANAEVFNGVIDVYGTEETGDALIGYDLAKIDDSFFARIVDATQAKGTVVIPAYVKYNNESYKVSAIVEGSFVGCRGLESVTLPNYEGFTILTKEGSPQILNGVFLDCDPVVLVKFSAHSAAIDAYFLGTTDMGATAYPYDIDEDVTEGVFAIVMKIVNFVKALIFKLLGIDSELTQTFFGKDTKAVEA